MYLLNQNINSNKTSEIIGSIFKASNENFCSYMSNNNNEATSNSIYLNNSHNVVLTSSANKKNKDFYAKHYLELRNLLFNKKNHEKTVLVQKNNNNKHNVYFSTFNKLPQVSDTFSKFLDPPKALIADKPSDMYINKYKYVTAPSSANSFRSSSFSFLKKTKNIKKINNITDIFSIGKKLGSGYTATVFDAVKINTNEQYAIKVISKERQKLVANENYYRDVYSYLPCIPHPNMIHIVDVLENKDNFYLVMEKCLGKDLVEFVLSYDPGDIPEEIAKFIMKQILLAVHFLHSNQLLHRDIKLDNVMFRDKKNEHVVMIDFDMCMFTNRKEPPKVMNNANEISVVGTKEYMAPECYRGEYSRASDLWGCGVILFVLIDGHFPFDVNACKCHKEIRKLLRNGCSFEGSIRKKSPLAVDLIQLLLSFNQLHRLDSAYTALCHRWFGGIPRSLIAFPSYCSSHISVSSSSMFSSRSSSPSSSLLHQMQLSQSTSKSLKNKSTRKLKNDTKNFITENVSSNNEFPFEYNTAVHNNNNNLNNDFKIKCHWYSSSAHTESDRFHKSFPSSKADIHNISNGSARTTRLIVSNLHKNNTKCINNCCVDAVHNSNTTHINSKFFNSASLNIETNANNDFTNKNKSQSDRINNCKIDFNSRGVNFSSALSIGVSISVGHSTLLTFDDSRSSPMRGIASLSNSLCHSSCLTSNKNEQLLADMKSRMKSSIKSPNNELEMLCVANVCDEEKSINFENSCCDFHLPSCDIANSNSNSVCEDIFAGRNVSSDVLRCVNDFPCLWMNSKNNMCFQKKYKTHSVFGNDDWICDRDDEHAEIATAKDRGIEKVEKSFFAQTSMNGFAHSRKDDDGKSKIENNEFFCEKLGIANHTIASETERKSLIGNNDDSVSRFPCFSALNEINRNEEGQNSAILFNNNIPCDLFSVFSHYSSSSDVEKRKSYFLNLFTNYDRNRHSSQSSSLDLSLSSDSCSCFSSSANNNSSSSLLDFSPLESSASASDQSVFFDNIHFNSCFSAADQVHLSMLSSASKSHLKNQVDFNTCRHNNKFNSCRINSTNNNCGFNNNILIDNNNDNILIDNNNNNILINNTNNNMMMMMNNNNNNVMMMTNNNNNNILMNNNNNNMMMTTNNNNNNVMMMTNNNNNNMMMTTNNNYNNMMMTTNNNNNNMMMTTNNNNNNVMMLTTNNYNNNVNNSNILVNKNNNKSSCVAQSESTINSRKCYALHLNVSPPANKVLALRHSCYFDSGESNFFSSSSSNSFACFASNSSSEKKSLITNDRHDEVYDDNDSNIKCHANNYAEKLCDENLYAFRALQNIKWLPSSQDAEENALKAEKPKLIRKQQCRSLLSPYSSPSSILSASFSTLTSRGQRICRKNENKHSSKVQSKNALQNFSDNRPASNILLKKKNSSLNCETPNKLHLSNASSNLTKSVNSHPYNTRAKTKKSRQHNQ